MSDWNDKVIAEFHEGKPRVADMFDLEALLILHTTGAKSGQQRVNPLAYFTINGDKIIVASAAGAPKNPDWYANIVATPEVSIESWQGGSVVTEQVTAQVAPGDERDALWERIVKMSPGFADYQTKTDRVIPVVKLLPRA